MSAAHPPLLCAPAVVSTSSWISAAGWGRGTGASAPAEPAPQAWPARWVRRTRRLRPALPGAAGCSPPGRGRRDGEFIFACGFPCLSPPLPAAVRSTHALGGRRRVSPQSCSCRRTGDTERGGGSLTAAPGCPLPQDARRPPGGSESSFTPSPVGTFFRCGIEVVPFYIVPLAGFMVPFFPCVSPPPATGPIAPRPPAQPRFLGRSPDALRLSPRSAPSRWSWSWGTEPRSGKNPPWRASPTTGWCLSEGPSTATFSTLWRKSSFTCTRASPGRKEVGRARRGQPRRNRLPAPAAGGLPGAGRPVPGSPPRRALPGGLGAGAAGGFVSVSVENKSCRQCGGGLPVALLPPPLGLPGGGGAPSIPFPPPALAAAGVSARGRRARAGRGSGSRLGGRPWIGVPAPPGLSLAGGTGVCLRVGLHRRFLPTCCLLLTGVAFSRCTKCLIGTGISGNVFVLWFGTWVWTLPTLCFLLSCLVRSRGFSLFLSTWELLKRCVCVVCMYLLKLGWERYKKPFVFRSDSWALTVLIILVGLVEVTVQIKEVSGFVYLWRDNG